MHILPEPRRRLRELAAERRLSLTGLSRMLERPDHYLTRFAREGHPLRLRDREVQVLATFFAVPVTDLGGDDPRWAKWKRPA